MKKIKEFATMCFSTWIFCALSIVLFVAVHNCECGTENSAEVGGGLLDGSLSRSPLYAPEVYTPCACGCHLTGDHGEIIASGRCSGDSSWRISVQNGYRIELNFTYLHFYEDKQWVNVKDGGSPESEVVIFNDGSSHISNMTSSTNQMLVDFFTNVSGASIYTYPLKATTPIHAHGFIAKYSTIKIDPFQAIEKKLNDMETSLKQQLDDLTVQLKYSIQNSCRLDVTTRTTSEGITKTATPATVSKTTPVTQTTASIWTETATQSTARQTKGGGHCKEDQFYCDSNWRCIPDYWVCDGDNDCWNGEDERNCPSHFTTASIWTETATQSTARQTKGSGHCNENQFYCESSEMCIYGPWVCDGDNDCKNGEDERNCRIFS